MAEKMKPVAFASASDLEAMAEGYVFSGVSCERMGERDVPLFTADQLAQARRPGAG